MNTLQEFDVIIIGSGPAGYVAATRSAQVGMKTAIVEKTSIGGMCINWGCVRMNTLLESAKFFARIKSSEDFGIEVQAPVFNWQKVKERSTKISEKISKRITCMLEKYGVEIISGEAKINEDRTVNVNGKSIKAANIIIATGSQSSETHDAFKNAPTLNPWSLFQMETIPEHIIISGKGSVAVEMAQFFNLIGKQVSIVASSGSFLPSFDKYLQEYIYEKLHDKGIGFLTGTISHFENGALYVDGIAVSCDTIINCSFRNATIPESDLGFELDAYSFIKTNDQFETNLKNIYAIGDVNGKSYLAQTASAQGLSVINRIKKIKENFSIAQYPLNLYTVPEIAQIGLTEEQIKKEGIVYKITEYPLTTNSKALIEGNSEGFIRILSERKMGQVLGVQIVAAHASDMISEAAAYMQMNGTVYDIAKSIHAHPTVSEVYTEIGFRAMEE